MLKLTFIANAIRWCGRNLPVGRAKLAAHTGRRIKRTGRRGETRRRIIHTSRVGNYDCTYHATKGWRVNKV